MICISLSHHMYYIYHLSQPWLVRPYSATWRDSHGTDHNVRISMCMLMTHRMPTLLNRLITVVVLVVYVSDEIVLREVRCEFANWIEISQDRVKWRTFINMYFVQELMKLYSVFGNLMYEIKYHTLQRCRQFVRTFLAIDHLL